MPKSREHEPARIKEHLSQRGKEQITNVDNSRTDEKMVTTKPEAEKTEAPKKKKNIIRVYQIIGANVRLDFTHFSYDLLYTPFRDIINISTSFKHLNKFIWC